SHGNAPEPSEGLVDLNSDVGERSEALADGSEEELLKLITSANIACGGHAGNEETMERVVRLAIKHGVRIGAHPSFPDRENFGRREMNLTFDEIRAAVTEQVQALTVIAHKLNARIAHVKPHGALYNIAARNARVAHAIAAGVGEVDNSLILMGLAGSGMLGVWRELGFRVAAEAFADRVYEPDGSLRLRKFPDALITDPDRAAQQALSIARDGITTASDGSQLQIEAQTICIHSDTPNAVAIARAVRRVLETEGFRLKATEG
ncbi:MAG: 5-oxoprolinase subunit PxpA, partial [Bacteroidota bacterium]